MILGPRACVPCDPQVISARRPTAWQPPVKPLAANRRRFS